MRRAALLVYFFLLASPVFATTRYVAQSAGIYSGGSACNGQTAITLAIWKVTAESAGDITYICGVVTGSAGGDGLVFGWSGSSGNPLTVIFDTGAQLNAPYWGTGYGNAHGGVVISGHSWITIDGGATGNAGQQTYVGNGIIQNTLSGTTGGSCPGGTCVSGHDTVIVALKNATNVIFQNIGLLNCYVRTSQSDENNTTSGTTIDIEPGTNGPITFTNTQINNCSGAMVLDLTSGTTSTLNFYNNEVYAVSSGTDIAQGTGNTGTITTLNWYGNWIHDFGPTWNDGSCSPYDFHHDGIHVFSYTTALTGLNVYNNLFSGDMGAGTAWIYYEQYAGGTGAMSIFNNVINSYATTNCPGQGSRSIEFEGNAITGLIYNNTIVGVNHSGTIMSGLYNNGAPAASFDLRNNTFSGYLNYLMEGQGNAAGVASTSNNNDWNVTHNNGWNTASFNSGTFTGWPAACSCDASAITGAPNLNAIYQPNAGSPLIAAGANLTGAITGINSDIYGSSRPGGGAWTIGAANAASGLVGPPRSLTLFVTP